MQANSHNDTNRASARLGGLPSELGLLFQLHPLQIFGAGVLIGTIWRHVQATTRSAALDSRQQHGLGVSLDQTLNDAGAGTNAGGDVQWQPSSTVKRSSTAGTGFEQGADGFVVGPVAEAVVDGTSSQRIVDCSSLGIVLEQSFDDVRAGVRSARYVQGNALVGRLLLTETHSVGLVQSINDLDGRAPCAGNVNGQNVAGFDPLEESWSGTPGFSEMAIVIALLNCELPLLAVNEQ